MSQAPERLNFFGTDGHRALVGEGLITPEGAFAAGLAIGAAALEANDRAMVPIGWDPRESSSWMQRHLTAGVTVSGADTMSLGVLPTPAVSYVMQRLPGATQGGIVTASHNDERYNGIKIIAGDGGKLTDEAQAAINDRITTIINDRLHTAPSSARTGQILNGQDYLGHYEDFLVANGTEETDLPFDGWRVVTDTANGAASGLAARVFGRLGATVIPIFNQPDGRNINQSCGATDTAALKGHVLSSKADVGIAFDGDADRVQMINRRGDLLHGDHLLYALATTDQNPHKGVVGTVMSNKGFENALTAEGIDLLRTDVGDRFVLQGLRETGWRLGGEQSGHIILSERLCTGDGMLAAIRTLAQARAAGRSLEDICDEVVLFPQRTISVPISNRSMINNPAVQGYIAEFNDRLGESGRLNARLSGTEKDTLRVMVEARDEKKMKTTLASAVNGLSLMFKASGSWLSSKRL